MQRLEVNHFPVLRDFYFSVKIVFFWLVLLGLKTGFLRAFQKLQSEGELGNKLVY